MKPVPQSRKRENVSSGKIKKKHSQAPEQSINLTHVYKWLHENGTINPVYIEPHYDVNDPLFMNEPFSRSRSTPSASNQMFSASKSMDLGMNQSESKCLVTSFTTPKTMNPVLNPPFSRSSIHPAISQSESKGLVNSFSTAKTMNPVLNSPFSRSNVNHVINQSESKSLLNSFSTPKTMNPVLSSPFSRSSVHPAISQGEPKGLVTSFSTPKSMNVVMNPPFSRSGINHAINIPRPKNPNPVYNELCYEMNPPRSSSTNFSRPDSASMFQKVKADNSAVRHSSTNSKCEDFEMCYKLQNL